MTSERILVVSGFALVDAALLVSLPTISVGRWIGYELAEPEWAGRWLCLKMERFVGAHSTEGEKRALPP